MTKAVPAPPIDPPNTRDGSSYALDEGFFSSKKLCLGVFLGLYITNREQRSCDEESKDLSSLALDELIGNLKTHEIVMEKDSKIYKGKKEKVKSIALKAKKESSDDETSTSESDDEQYDMADEKKGKNDRKCFGCGDLNHRIGDCPKPSRNKDQKAFIEGSWSDNKNDAEDKTDDETCLMAQSSNEVMLEEHCLTNEMDQTIVLLQTYDQYKSLFFLPTKAYNGGKQAHASHKAKNMVSTKRCLELLHMDLFGPSAIKSYGGNLYTLVVVDDFSRYTWTRFLKTKNEAFEKFEILSRKIQNQLGSSIIAIRADHGWEFDNEVQFEAYCDAQGITHYFSAPRTLQSNGVVERKNKTLQEMSRTMLNEQSIPQKFWCNVVDTSTYTLNRILIRPILEKPPYKIFRGRKPSLEYFKVFGSKFDPKSYEGVFLGYSQNSKAYIVLNKHTINVEELLNVTFDESPPPTKLSPLVDDDVV
ncbi:retrovirus-related pol polyprotein from transposon TNT 1-94 [Tanacetum coccineum]